MSNMRKQASSGQLPFAHIAEIPDEAASVLRVGRFSVRYADCRSSPRPVEPVCVCLYVTAVRGYQAVVSPRIRSFVRCRYYQAAPSIQFRLLNTTALWRA